MVFISAFRRRYTLHGIFAVNHDNYQVNEYGMTVDRAGCHDTHHRL